MSLGLQPLRGTSFFTGVPIRTRPAATSLILASIGKWLSATYSSIAGHWDPFSPSSFLPSPHSPLCVPAYPCALWQSAGPFLPFLTLLLQLIASLPNVYVYLLGDLPGHTSVQTSIILRLSSAAAVSQAYIARMPPTMIFAPPPFVRLRTD